MQTVTVSASQAYPVHIGGGLLAQAGALAAGMTPSRTCAVITDSTVERLYAPWCAAPSRKRDLQFAYTPFPPGSRAKIWKPTVKYWAF